MTEVSSPIRPPLQASPARRVLHTLIAIAGWVLFVYWWWLVFLRVSRHEIRFTVLFIVLSLLAIVLTTSLWAWHNVRIHRRKGPRTRVRETSPDFSHDRVGRAVVFDAATADVRSAPVVRLHCEPTGKRYSTAASVPPRGAASAPAP